jgi:hypothetical protein
MHNHDYETIMALAEGSLDPVAAAAARTAIDACPECARDLELQVAGLQALKALPAAGLTEMESARLHRDLRRELGIATPQARQPAARRRMPLAALGTAAAVLVAVVLVGPGLNLIGGASDSTTDSTVFAAATTAAAQTTAAPEAALAPAEDLTSDGAAESQAPVAEATTTSAAGGAAESERLYAYFREQNPDLDALRDDLADFGFDENVGRSNALQQADDSILEDDLAAVAACINGTLSSEDTFLEGFQLARGLLDGREVLLVVYLAEDPENSALIAHAADNCEELARAGPPAS